MTAAAKNLMTEGDLRRKIILFAIPVFLGQLFQQLYSTVDSLIVGNILGAQALASVTSTGALVYLLIGFFLGFATGSEIVIARHIGARNEEQTEKAVHTAVSIGLFFSVIMTLAGIFFAPVILKWMGTPDDVLPGAITYVRIYFGGSFGIVMYNIFVGILRASGDSRHPLYYLVASSLVNIVLDWIFVAFFGMGIAGAALATVISELVSVGLALHRLLHIDASYRVDLRKIMLDADNAGTIIRYGIPSAIQGCVVDFSNILIQSYVNSFGMAAIAGIGAYSRVEGFIFLPVTAFSLALSTFVSQNIGARQYKRARDGIRFSTLCSVLMIGSIGILIYAFAPQLIAMFVQDPEVIYYGVTRARVCSMFFILMGYSHITAAALRGLGHPVEPMLVYVFCWCAVRVVVLMTIGKVIHNFLLVCWIYPFTWALSTITYAVLYHRITREQIKAVGQM